MSTTTTPPDGMVSNVEKIIRSTLGETMDLTGIGASRIEYYLMLLKDMIERLATGAVRPMGETTTPLTDGATTNPITIDGVSYTAQANDIVFYGNKEFLFVNSTWREVGDLTNLTADMVDDTNTTNKFITAADVTKLGKIIIDPSFTGNVYVSSTAPTGDIPDGSIWIGG